MSPTSSQDKTTWAEPASHFVETLQMADSALVHRGSEPLEMSNGQLGWLLLKGTVSIFLIDDDGIRSHLVTADEGGWLPSLTGEAGETLSNLIAVPTQGAVVVPLTYHQFTEAIQRLTEHPAAVQMIEMIADDFRKAVGDLEATDLVRSALPADALRLKVGKTYSISEGSAFFSDMGTVWIQTPPESLTLLRSEETRVDHPSRFPTSDHLTSCPVFTHHFWQGEVAFQCTPITTAERLRQGPILDDLIKLRLFSVKVILKLQAQRSTQLLDRVRLSARKKGETLEASISDLGSVLDTGRRLATDPSQTPIARGMELVCRELDIDFKPKPGQSQRSRHADDPVRALSEDMRLLTREVTLTGAWWKEDHGSYLAFLGTDRKPIALLQNPNTRSYTAVDPVTTDQQPVDEAYSKLIDPKAHTFFKPLGLNDRTPLSLFKLGITGSGRDLWRIGILILLSGILSLVLPVVTGWIMDPVIPNGELSTLAVLAVGLAVAGCAGIAFSYTQSLAMMRIEGRMENIVQTAVWDRLLKVPIGFFHRYTAGDLVNRADGVDAMRKFVTTTFLNTLMHSTTAIFSLGLMLYYKWQLALAIALVAILYVTIAIPVGFRFVNTTRIMMALNGRLQGVVLQLLTAVPKIRLAGAERGAFNQWSQRFAELQRLTYKQRVLNIILAVAKTALTSVSTIVLIGILAWEGGVIFALFASGSHPIPQTSGASLIPLDTAKFIAFNVAMGQFIASAFGLTELGIKVLNLTPLYERVKPILNALPESNQNAQPIENLRGLIEFHNVTFRYEGQKKPILSDLSFSVTPGKMVAIVGPSGAGKSTIVRLLLGFEKPESGSVLVDKISLPQLDMHQFRKKIGVVLQESRLISGSIFSNIAAGADTTTEEVWRAAERVGLADDIRAMPMGMQTYISDGANTISGGQKQRITAARAIIKEPRVLIFDEATSALDNTTQSRVTNSIAEMNASRIVIAHRLSTIKEADCIYVLNEGHMVESGTYDELMAQNGFFSKLAKRQLH